MPPGVAPATAWRPRGSGRRPGRRASHRTDRRSWRRPAPHRPRRRTSATPARVPAICGRANDPRRQVPARMLRIHPSRAILEPTVVRRIDREGHVRHRFPHSAQVIRSFRTHCPGSGGAGGDRSPRATAAASVGNMAAIARPRGSKMAARCAVAGSAGSPAVSQTRWLPPAPRSWSRIRPRRGEDTIRVLKHVKGNRIRQFRAPKA